MNKRGKRLIALLIFFIYVLVVTLFLKIVVWRENGGGYKYELYTVQKNDTLWTIEKKHAPNKDIRKVIELVRSKNNLSPLIYEGQEIYIITD